MATVLPWFTAEPWACRMRSCRKWRAEMLHVAQDAGENLAGVVSICDVFSRSILVGKQHGDDGLTFVAGVTDRLQLHRLWLGVVVANEDGVEEEIALG